VIDRFKKGNTMKIAKIVLTGLLAGSFSTAVLAQSVQVQDAWARATVQGQKATGAFMKLTAKDGAKLVSVASPVAGVSEVHEMAMEGSVMKMRALANGLDLPAGQTVALKPGGYHVMLMDLKMPLAKETTIPLTLVFQDAKGVKSTLELKVPVSRTSPVTPSMDNSQHKM